MLFLNSLRKGELPNPGAASVKGIPDFGKAQEHLNTLLGQSSLESDTILFDESSIEGKLRIAEEAYPRLRFKRVLS